MTNNIRINDIPENERPMEKLLKYGAEELSDAELLAIILRSGTKGENILVEIELKLKNFLNHNHPIETVDYIVCWRVDLEENRIHKMDNQSCIFVNSKGRKYLMFDEKELEVVELKSVIKQIINAPETSFC